MYCGPQCMAFVLKHFDNAPSVEDLARLAQTSENGTRPWDIVKTFLDLGYFSEFRVGLDYFDLKSLLTHFFIIVDWWSIFDEDGKPAVGDGHYSVVLDVTGKAITLYDPDISGARTLPRAVFEAHWYDVDIDAKGVRADVLCGALLIKKPSGHSANGT